MNKSQDLFLRQTESSKSSLYKLNKTTATSQRQVKAKQIDLSNLSNKTQKCRIQQTLQGKIIGWKPKISEKRLTTDPRKYISIRRKLMASDIKHLNPSMPLLHSTKPSLHSQKADFSAHETHQEIENEGKTRDFLTFSILNPSQTIKRKQIVNYNLQYLMKKNKRAKAKKDSSGNLSLYEQNRKVIVYQNPTHDSSQGTYRNSSHRYHHSEHTFQNKNIAQKVCMQKYP